MTTPPASTAVMNGTSTNGPRPIIDIYTIPYYRIIKKELYPCLNISPSVDMHPCTAKTGGNIRRLLAAGRLEGQKVGREWIIPTDARYPEDGRIKAGNTIAGENVMFSPGTGTLWL